MIITITTGSKPVSPVLWIGYLSYELARMPPAIPSELLDAILYPIYQPLAEQALSSSGTETGFELAQSTGYPSHPEASTGSGIMDNVLSMNEYVMFDVMPDPYYTQEPPAMVTNSMDTQDQTNEFWMPMQPTHDMNSNPGMWTYPTPFTFPHQANTEPTENKFEISHIPTPPPEVTPTTAIFATDYPQVNCYRAFELMDPASAYEPLAHTSDVATVMVRDGGRKQPEFRPNTANGLFLHTPGNMDKSEEAQDSTSRYRLQNTTQTSPTFSPDDSRNNPITPAKVAEVEPTTTDRTETGPNNADTTNATSRKKRRAFDQIDQDARKETSKTREIGACVRCRLQRIRVRRTRERS